MSKNPEKIWVIKNSGEKAEFQKEKLQRSLTKSGATKKDIQYIISDIEKILFPGISTKEIYKKAFKLLRKTSRPTAAKYKLKKALMELGPSGFPFERYLAEVLSHEGYQVEVGRIIEGHCVSHEVDIVAKKDNQVILIECKFHSESRRNCDVKVPLYIYSRFLDLAKQRKKNSKNEMKNYSGMIATNTRFSDDATRFGLCSGLLLLAWDFPKKESLKNKIDRAGVHPITCLTTLTKKEKKQLLHKMVVLCKDIRNNKKVLQSIGIKGNRVNKIMTEANALCKT